jgi:hypothetical protein
MCGQSATGELLCLAWEKFEWSAADYPALPRDLLFALGRVLSLWLRDTTFLVRK